MSDFMILVKPYISIRTSFPILLNEFIKTFSFPGSEGQYEVL